jgi:hypothetical protein
MNRALARGLIISGIALLLLGLAFILQLDFVRYVWPWQLSPLSAYFLASICASIACPIIWIGILKEQAVLAGGSLDLLVTSLGMAIFCYKPPAYFNLWNCVGYFCPLLYCHVPDEL